MAGVANPVLFLAAGPSGDSRTALPAMIDEAELKAAFREQQESESTQVYRVVSGGPSTEK